MVGGIAESEILSTFVSVDFFSNPSSNGYLGGGRKQFIETLVLGQEAGLTHA